MGKDKKIDTLTKPSLDFLARQRRFNDAIQLKTPDRVPVANMAITFMTRYAGLTEAESYYDYERMADAWVYSAMALNADVYNSPMILTPGPVLDLLGTNAFKWPKAGVADNIPFQYVEKEFLKADEYDAFITDPSDFTVRTLMPRMAKVFEPLAMLPPVRSFSSPYLHFGPLAILAGAPLMVGMFQTLGRIGDEMARFNKVRFSLGRRLFEAGYPTAFGAITNSPYDWLSDYFRGMRGSMLDLYRNKDKIKAVTELLLPDLIGAAVQQSKMTDNKRVFIPLHRGAGGFMSREQFSEFYWPGLKALLLGLIDAGLTPLPFFEGDYTDRLEFLKELPPGKIAAHFDKVDKVKFKEILGGKLCFWGDVPASLLIAGSVNEVRDYVKGLIDIFDGTGLIIDGAVESYPPESKFENVEALIQTTFEYGKN